MKRILGILAAIIVMIGISATPASAISTCSSSGICFYRSTSALPIDGYTYQTTTYICHAVPANQTRYVDNNTAYRWYVWTGPNCTGSPGPIYPNHEGPMAGIYYDNIESVYRTSQTS